LLLKIPRARSDQKQRMLLAAAITTLMRQPPIVVGGTAEAYWAGGAYHPTDLDLCPEPEPRDLTALRSAGLRKVGRHWTRDDLPVAVEFPGSGDDIERTVTVAIEGVEVRMIACEDLYLDRIRQATAVWPHEDLSFDSAFEVALTTYRNMDWDYIRQRIAAATRREQLVGDAMRQVNRRVRARARRRASELGARKAR
jgi:hypothetical protein